MLRIRIITALIILPVTIATVFLAPPWLFKLLVALVMLMGSWEFRRLADLPGTSGWILLVLQLVIIALLIHFWPVAGNHALLVLGIGCLVWLLMFSRLAYFHEGVKQGDAYRRLGFLSALAAITFCWYSLAWLQDQAKGPYVVFLVLLIIWASDVGAYFSGKQFGKRQLAPMISPRKTWEGVFGGALLAIAAAFLWSEYVADLDISVFTLVGLSLLTTLTSVCGDLFISLHKRSLGLKDTGTIFPGHGGVLDRYDSLLAGAPFFALAILVLVL